MIKGYVDEGDWVCAASVRSALRLSGWSGPVTVASLFGQRPDFAEPGDVALAGDADLVTSWHVAGSPLWWGDPLLARIPGVPGARHVRTAPGRIQQSFRQGATLLR